MNYYYLDAANQPAGPLPLEEIHRKAGAGEIPANPMIAAVGTSQWRPLAGGTAAGPEGAFDHYLTDRVGTVLQGARQLLGAGFLNDSLALAVRLGHIAVLLGAAVGLVYIIYTAGRSGSWFDIGGGLVLVVGLICAQYATRRFFSVNESLLTPTRLANPALLDCLALLALFGTLTMLLITIVSCIRFGIWQPLLPAFLTGALWTYFATVALHPATVKVEIAPTGAGEEVIGIIAFLIKTTLKLVPLFFFAGSVLGSLVIVLSFFDLGEYVQHVASGSLLPLPRGFQLPAGALGFQGIGLVFTACLMVPLAHLMFLAVSLPLDLWRALLSLPGKLDVLRK